jgi:hypothetical protein
MTEQLSFNAGYYDVRDHVAGGGANTGGRERNRVPPAINKAKVLSSHVGPCTNARCRRTSNSVLISKVELSQVSGECVIADTIPQVLLWPQAPFARKLRTCSGFSTQLKPFVFNIMLECSPGFCLFTELLETDTRSKISLPAVHETILTN